MRVKFDGNIVQFGFGAVGKSFYEKVSKEIKFNENRYYVITKYMEEFDAFIAMGGMAANFVTQEITKDNYQEVFGTYLNSGDLLLDFADTVGTADLCDWCAGQNIMYINTGAADWPENWLNIFEVNQTLVDIKEKYRSNPAANRHPIVLQHGNNPGLVSHFVKAGIAYIVRKQAKNNRYSAEGAKDIKQLNELLAQNKFNEAARRLGIRMIHVNDIDLQEVAATYPDNALINTWCVDAFLFEMISEATMILGSHDELDMKKEYKYRDPLNGFIEYKNLAVDQKYRTYYPDGAFDGYLIPHEETITIAKSLEVREGDNLVYRPSVMFLYAPCRIADQYFSQAKVNEYPDPDPAGPADGENVNGEIIIRGYRYPQHAEIVCRENILAGTEYVGVLLSGDSFEPLWVGNRIEPSFLYKNPHGSYWQTPTITPVAMSALAAVGWMIKNKDKGGIYFPEDIADYHYILKTAEKYISKTIFKTIGKTIDKDN